MGITLSSCLRFPRTWSEEEGADASVEDVELDEVPVREGSAENPPVVGDSNADRGQADAYHSSSFRYHGEVPDIEHAPAMQVSLKNFKDPSDVEVVVNHIKYKKKWYLSAVWVASMCLWTVFILAIWAGILLRSELAGTVSANTAFQPVVQSQNFSAQNLSYLNAISITVLSDSCYKFSPSHDPVSCAAYSTIEQLIDVTIQQDPSSMEIRLVYTDWTVPPSTASTEAQQLTTNRTVVTPNVTIQYALLELGILSFEFQTANDSIVGKPAANAVITLPASLPYPPSLIYNSQHNGAFTVQMEDFLFDQVYITDNNTQPNTYTLTNLTAYNITVISDLASLFGSNVSIVAPEYVNLVTSPTIEDYTNATSQPIICDPTAITNTGSLNIQVGGQVTVLRALQGRTGNMNIVTTGIGAGSTASISFAPQSFVGNFYLNSQTSELGLQGYSLSTSQQGSIGTGCQVLYAAGSWVNLAASQLPISYELPAFVGGQLYTGSTANRSDLSSSSCGGQYAPDFAISWTSPGNAYYSFDLEGSIFDGTIYIISQSTGEVLACGWRRPVGITLDGNTQILIVVDGAYTEQPGGPFYLNIRRGYYSPLTVMTELLQRLIAVTNSQIGPSVMLNYQQQRILSQILGTNTLYFIGALQVSTPTFTPPFVLVTGKYLSPWPGFPNVTSSLAFWRGYDSTDPYRLYEKTEFGLFIPIPTGLTRWQGESLSSLSWLKYFRSFPGADDWLAGLRFNNFFSNDFIYIASSSPDVNATGVNWYPTQVSSSLSEGFNFRHHILVDPGTVFDLWLYLIGNATIANNSMLTATVVPSNPYTPFIAPSVLTFNLGLSVRSSNFSNLLINVANPFTSSPTVSGTWTAAKDIQAFGAFDWLTIPSLASIYSGSIQPSSNSTSRVFSVVSDVKVSLVPIAGASGSTSSGPQDLVPSNSTTTASITINNSPTTGYQFTVTANSPLPFSNITSMFNYVLRQASNPLPLFVTEEFCVRASSTLDSITMATSAPSRLLNFISALTGISLSPPVGLSVCLTVPLIANGTVANCGGGSLHAGRAYIVLRTFNGAFAWDASSGLSPPLKLCVLPALGLKPWIGGNAPYANWGLQLSPPSFASSDPRIVFKSSWMTFGIIGDSLPYNVSVVTNMVLAPVGGSVELSFLLSGTYFPSQSTYTLSGGLPSNSSSNGIASSNNAIWYPLGLSWIGVTDAQISAVLQNSWAVSPSIFPLPTVVQSITINANILFPSLPWTTLQGPLVLDLSLPSSSLALQFPSIPFSNPANTSIISLLYAIMDAQTGLGGTPPNWLNGVFPFSSSAAFNISLILGDVTNFNLSTDGTSNFVGGLVCSFDGWISIPEITDALPFTLLSAYIDLVLPLVQSTNSITGSTVTYAALQAGILNVRKAAGSPVVYSYA